MKRHNLQPPFRESSDSLRQQAASTNLPMPYTPASGNGVYAWAFGAIALHPHSPDWLSTERKVENPVRANPGGVGFTAPLGSSQASPHMPPVLYPTVRRTLPTALPPERKSIEEPSTSSRI